ncbi:hypothetical protein PSHT_03194 [Puccinia striiformis]|uniref:Uncharacterized protein n=1 Tax=Puccinia striiformis TaxID=27350 RepID=A0A2S4WG69_9BASI|nr:hypothetical protein PSHT_03194 [Puccinia striiformis]
MCDVDSNILSYGHNRFTLVKAIQRDDLNVPMVGDDDIDAGWISQPVIGLPPDLMPRSLNMNPYNPGLGWPFKRDAL